MTPAHIDLLPGWRLANGTHMAALRVTMDPGWHTYWRAPGEAGIPPEVDWSRSTNLAGVTVHWPVPEIFRSNGMTTLGYEGELILPFEVVAQDPGKGVVLDAQILLGVCNDICMPMEAEVAGVLADTATPDARIEAALARRPDTAAEAGVVSARCTVEPIADGLRVTASIDLPALGPDEHAVMEPADPQVWVSEPTVQRSENMLSAEADLVPPAAVPFDLDTNTLRLTVLAQGRAVDIEGCNEIR